MKTKEIMTREVDALHEEYEKRRAIFVDTFKALGAIIQQPDKFRLDKLSDAANDIVQSVDALRKVLVVESYVEETAGLYDSEFYMEVLNTLLEKGPTE